MRLTNEKSTPCIIATLESINPLPLRHRDGKLVADWNSVHWQGLSEPSDYLIRLALTQLEIDADDFSKEFFNKDEENYARVGIDILLANPERFSNVEMTKLNKAIHQYLYYIHPYPDQITAPLLEEVTNTSGELPEVKIIAEEFLSRHGTTAWKRASIKTPYMVKFSGQVAQVSGSYGHKPTSQATPQDVRSVIGAVDALCISDRTLGILLEKGKKMEVAFDEATQFLELRQRLGDQHWYEFLVKEEVDAKGRIVNHLVSIGDEASPPLPLFS